MRSIPSLHLRGLATAEKKLATDEQLADADTSHRWMRDVLTNSKHEYSS